MRIFYFFLFTVISCSIFAQGRGKNVFYESFETSFPPTGWTKYKPDGGSGWRADTAGTTLNGWTGSILITAPGGGGDRIACMTYIDGGNTNNDSWLITPRLTISAGEYLMFWAVNFTPYEDTLDVLLSTTNNTHNSFTTTLLSFSPSMDGVWVKQLINLNAYTGQQIYLAFREHVSDNYNYGGYIGLDKVEINLPPTSDAGVTEVFSPETGCGLSNAEDITVTIKNFGVSPVSNIPVNYKFNNGVTVRDTCTATIPAGGTYDFTFSIPADASLPGKDSVYAWTSLSGDQDTANNKSGYHIFGNTLPSPVPYNFNAEWNTADWYEAYYWTYTDLEGNGYWGYSDTLFAHNGTGFWLYYGSTTSGANDWLISKCLELTAGVNYEMYFWYMNSQQGGKTNKMRFLVGTSNDVADFTQVLDLSDINDAGAATYTKATAYYSPPVSGKYYLGWQVYSTAGNGNLYLDDIHVNFAEGIGENKEMQIRIYPNPSKDVVYIETEFPIKKMILTDISGKEITVYYPGRTQASMNVSGLTKGLYFLKVETDKCSVFRKILLN